MERRKTILICDDEPALRELIRASMDDGYEFAEASDGIIAMELAKEVSPDMVILDLMLPRLSGLEVLARLNDDERPQGRPGARDHRVERDARGRARRRGGRVRDEAVRPGGAEDRSQEAGGRVKGTAIDLSAGSDARCEPAARGDRRRRLRRAHPRASLRCTNANKHEARSKKVTASALSAGQARPRTSRTALRGHV